MKRTLRDTNVVTDFNIFEVIDPHGFSNPAVVSYAQAPGVFDPDICFDHQALSHAGAKQSKEPGFECIGKGNHTIENEIVNNIPQKDFPPRAGSIAAHMEFRKVSGGFGKLHQWSYGEW